MKGFGSPRIYVGCGLVLFSIFMLAAASEGQLIINPSTVSFGSVPIGGSVTQPVVLSNTGNTDLTITDAAISGAGFSFTGLGLPRTLAPRQSVNLTTTFVPQSDGNSSGSLSLACSILRWKNHTRGGPYRYTTATLALAGTGAGPGQLTANPSSLNFANVQVGSSLTLMDSLTNTGSAVVTVSQVTMTGASFVISGLNAPFSLNPAASVTFSALFAPQSAGNASGSIMVGSDASNPTLTVSLSGSGSAQGQLSLTPVALAFGNVTVGATSSKASTLSAIGASITVSSASLSSGEFSLTGISFPLTITAGQSVPYTLTFAPQTSGSASASVSFASNAANSPNEALSGDGVAAPPHSVSLTWNSGAGAAGFNVYRGTASGGPYSKINSVPDATAAYDDNSVVAGQTYYYVATAVDGSGVESRYSNEVPAAIPSP